MNELETIKLLTLLVLKERPQWGNSYDLTKLLAWKFKYIYFVDLINALNSDHLIEVSKTDTMSYFSITKKGQSFLTENHEGLIKNLITRFPHEIEFINSINKY